MGLTVVITEWGLQSYLDLRGSNTFTRDDYRDIIRPDVERLKTYDPQDPVFQNARLWGPAEDYAGNRIADGHKMKWHNIGPGRVQLRVFVAVLNGEAYLCQAYSKTSKHLEGREAAKFKTYIQAIKNGRYHRRGVIP
jgi:hypothetical protein